MLKIKNKENTNSGTWLQIQRIEESQDQRESDSYPQLNITSSLNTITPISPKL